MNTKNSNEIIERAGCGLPYMEMHADIIKRQKNSCAQCGRSLSFARILSTVSGSMYCEKCAPLARARANFDSVRRR